MTENRPIVHGAPVPADWFNTLQQVLGSYISPGFNVTVLNPTTLQVAAGPDNAQIGVMINGRWRWISANAQAAAPAGLAVGDNPVFVTASDNSFTPSGDPNVAETDNTDYSFHLLVLPVGQVPSGTGTQTLWRQVGTATWSGTAFTDVRAGASTVPKHGSTHTGSDPLSWPLVAQAIAQSGTLALRPVASSANRGFFYWATDASGGTLYESNGTAWVQLTIGLTDSRLSDQRTPLDGSVTQTKLAAGAAAGQSYGTLFPTSGLYAGYRFTLFVANPAGSQVAIDCIYRPDIDATFPWFAVGGPGISGSTSLTIPRSGNWWVVVGASGTDFSAVQNVKLDLTAGGVTLQARAGAGGGGTEGVLASPHDEGFMSALAAGQVLQPSSDGNVAAVKPYITAHLVNAD